MVNPRRTTSSIGSHSLEGVEVEVSEGLGPTTELHNNGLHQTRRGGVALPSSRPVVEARLAGEAGCCPDAWMRPGTALSVALASALVLGACGRIDPCENKVMSRTLSPDGASASVVFVRDCGATTQYSTQVSIIPGKSVFLEQPTEWSSTEGGNALVVDGGDWASPEPIHVQWVSSARLILTRPRGAQVFQQHAQVRGIAIEHREASPK